MLSFLVNKIHLVVKVVLSNGLNLIDFSVHDFGKGWIINVAYYLFLKDNLWELLFNLGNFLFYNIYVLLINVLLTIYFVQNLENFSDLLFLEYGQGIVTS